VSQSIRGRVARTTAVARVVLLGAPSTPLAQSAGGGAPFRSEELDLGWDTARVAPSMTAFESDRPWLRAPTNVAQASGVRP
jgi:hypothetical protein